MALMPPMAHTLPTALMALTPPTVLTVLTLLGKNKFRKYILKMEKLKSKISQKNNQIIFWLKSEVYPLEAIYSTAHAFLDRTYVFLDGDPKKEIAVSLKGKEKLNNKELERLESEFHNELLNYLLRTEVSKRNQKIREYIVGTALVSSLPTELLAPSLETKTTKKEEMSDWQKDPLGIAIPWEEKYGKKKKMKKRK